MAQGVNGYFFNENDKSYVLAFAANGPKRNRFLTDWLDRPLHQNHYCVFHHSGPITSTCSHRHFPALIIFCCLSLPDQLPSFSSSSCPSSQNSRHRGHWGHKASRPALQNPPVGRGMSRQPNDKIDSSGCKHSSPQSE